MRLRVVWVGKTKDERLRSLAGEYLKRLSRFTRCEVSEVAAAKSSGEREGIEEEGKRILSGLRANTFAVLLDVEGREWSSTALAAEIERWQLAGRKEVAFIIGGHNGVSREVAERADARWSLSRLTLTHEMVRVLLAEQLYRAYTIIHGLPYQK
ncbi:MAG TPA: 23S rRNA (pseudouridine(1915)-N(3))-methyltransferase RlmH [Pyrinomonadaceae bacterium]|nr:23S rRNA (pseudouridine(1915)-N(3))-methyltransferase RlmH [Pyrinomonadaceae bacterium]